MRWSRYYLFTTREVPADAEVISHRLMIRAGMLKKLAAGIYTYLPFALRSLTKLQEIVRRELAKADCVELLMPAIQPAELWQESGRWEQYGKELLRIDDRHERKFCFGPTHEEVITDLVRGDVRSYRQLPINLFQIQTKFRDEIRPRFGLMRGREFLMKDGYSFHADEACLDRAYQAMSDAYRRIFEACGLDYVRVEADTGTIGGSFSHEFMVVAATGESLVVRDSQSDYAANVEKAIIGALARPEPSAAEPLQEVVTPGTTAVEEVARFLGVGLERIVKTLLYEADEKLVAVAIRGDREVNEIKLKNFLGCENLALAGEAAVRKGTGAPVGFAGPVGLSASVRLLGDETVRGLANFVVGANKADAHLTGVNWGRDAAPSAWGDFNLAHGGDPSPVAESGGVLEEFRGIEVGHIFKLGTKYSESMGCTFLDDAGQSHPMTMGCYGLGIGRTVAAAIEQNNDDDGIIWPLPLAPFQVLLIALNPNDEAVVRQSEELYGRLQEKGVEVLFDDRDARPGVKFKDADLIGIPIRVVVGARALAEGQVELSLRRDREKQLVAVGDVLERVATLVQG
jgi:prolyl-tRNA synthetase